MNRLTYVGHATLLIELDGQTVLTDPLLTSRVSHLNRSVPVPDTADWRPDAVLISHLHGDHLHLPSLKRLPRDTHLIVPRGARPYLQEQGFANVAEVDAGESVAVGRITVEATVSNHPGRPMPGRPDTACLGYLLHASHHIYFAGDTDLFPEMGQIGEAVDVALLPVWGWGPTLGVGHMDPFRAAKSLEMLQPRLAIPIHWGTYFPIGLRPILPSFLRRPPWLFAQVAANLAPEVEVQVLDPGQSFNLTEFFDGLGPA